MDAHLGSRLTWPMICLAGLIMGALLQLPVQAAGSDIVISREVKPRSATRPALMPDPNPQQVNPDQSRQIRQSVGGARLSGEISDSEFATITTGTSLRSGLQPAVLLNDPTAITPVPGRNAQGASSVGGGGLGATSRIGGDVSRSVQQGLSPLQNLGK